MTRLSTTRTQRTFARSRSMPRPLVILLIASLLLSQAGAAFTPGAGLGTAHAEVLSGAEQVTLVRAPQQTPDGLGASRLDGLQYADPTAQVDLVLPPVANNQGDAQVTHPLSVPAGRGGVGPNLALSYSSTSGNGWVGLGWDLSVGAVTIDTRWGVPRYAANQESETYVLDGEVLAPTAVRSTLLNRASERIFTRRTEGAYERIQRHGSGPGAYWWEVTNKAGTRRYYGGTPEGGRDPAAILADGNGHEFKWGLKQIRDISNNTTTFRYVTVTGTGVGSNSVALGREMYLDSIVYNGSVAPGVPDDPAYEIRFVRDSQLGEPRRPDVSIDARGGFLRVTSDLLRHVDVYHRGTLARRFVLNYGERAFGKTLLANVIQAGADGLEYARHTFDYYNDVGHNGSTYQGLAAGTTWNTQNDGIGNGINLGAFGSGNASALGGSESLGGDGRAYIGFNPFDPAKEGSFGGAFVLKGDDDTALLELRDINGDNLPDKVFKDNGGVSYRLNTSGPRGTTTFGPKRQVTGISSLSRESSFAFAVGPEAYFGVNVMYNHSWAWAWGKAYFIDVNVDGLADLVDNGTVYFNRLDSNGNPTFSTDSSQTGVPIDIGTVDPAVLPDLSDIEDQQRAQAPLQDTLRRWEARWDGQISIQGNVQLLPPAAGGSVGDGVRVAIQHNDNERWSALIGGTDYTPKTPTNVSSIDVSRGDHLYFRVGSRDDGASDRVSWDPVITYLNLTPALDANGLNVHRFQGSEDFTLAGLNNMFVVVPYDGAVRVAGDFVKLHKTTDDITVQVQRNGSNAGAPQTIGRDAIGTFPVLLDVNVQAQDQLMLLVKIDSPVDLAAFSWLPRVTYTSATLNGAAVTVTDPNGDPLLDLQAAANIQVYPRTNLSAPQTTWTAPANGSVTADTDVAFQLFTNEDGTVVVTVKKKITPLAAGDPPSELVAKQTLIIENGQVVNAVPANLTFAAEAGAEYWFDLSVAQPGLGSVWLAGSVNVTQPPNPSVDVPVARHWTHVPEQIFPPSYRGWGYAGYNAEEGRATAAIDESRLVFDPNDYPQAEPQIVGGNPQYPTYNDVDPNYQNPVQGKAYFYAPWIVIDQTTGAVADRQWRGSKANLFGAASQASSSRVGPDSIGLPGASQLAGASGVTRFSLTEADAIAGGIGGLVGGSYAWGKTEGYIDFFDMNGDQFPDVIGSGSIQYTSPRGALQSTATTISQLSDSVRDDKSTSKTLDGGGTAAEIKADSKGNSSQSQAVVPASGKNTHNSSGKGSTGHAEAGDPSQTGGSIGLSGSLGWSTTGTDDDSPFSDQLERELADINGDSLPDRITTYKNGRITVAFNLGYRFDNNVVEWPGGAFEQGYSTSASIGPNLGFSTPVLSFSGGVSLGGSDDEARSTWVDLNGDGLVDNLRISNGDVVVRFNTGAGLTGDVDWGNFRENKIARSKSVSLGGGVDFTIGIGPLCLVACYLILNPGGHVTGGISRSELELSDVNGDGYPDHIASTADASMDVSLNTTGRTNLLKSIANPLGGTISLDYTREGNTTSEAFSQWVMSRVAVDDGRAGDGPSVQLTTYEYANNVYHALERSFLGYATVTAHQHDTSVAGDPILRSYERVYRNGNIFDTGLLASETLTGPNGALKATFNEWKFVDANDGTIVDMNPDPAGVGLLDKAVFPQLIKTESVFYDDGVLAKRTWNTFAYDTLGNIIETVDVGEPDLPSDDVIAITTFSDCRTSSWVGLPYTFEVRDGNGQLLRSRQADDLLCANGAVTTLWEDAGNGLAQTNLAFDAWGNYNQIIYPENANGERYQVDYVYDADHHTHIARVEDSFGLVGEATFHGPTGQIASQTDANGQVTSYTYDAQGRLATLTGPYEQGTGHATITYEYFPTAPGYAHAIAHHFDAFHPTDTIDTVRFLDGIGRETQTKQDATVFRGPLLAPEDVMVVAGAVEFDALARPVKEWYPLEEPLGTIGTYNTSADSVAPTQFAWTLLDQLAQVTAPDGSTTATVYDFDDATLYGTTMFLNTRTDPLGKVRRSYSDIRNNILANEVSHDTGMGVQQLRTSYVYDPLQQLRQVIDTAGNVTTHEYDLMGRRTATTTPDAGRVELTYDLASQIIRRVTPNLRASGGQISYTYDFNRLTGITYSDDTPDVSYEYGAAGAPNNGAGRVVRVEDGARLHLQAYGRLGEVIEETTTMLVHNLNTGTMDRLTWTTGSAYDAWGRPVTITYPDGEVVSYGYDSGGLMASIVGEKAGTTYAYLEQQYDKFLARRFQVTGNNVATELRYNAQTRRLERAITNAPGRIVQDLTYSYDLVGNVLTANDAAPVPVPGLMGGTSQQTFAYDDLYQLVQASGRYNFAPRKHRTYSYSLSYDNLGNIVRKAQTDTVYNNPKGTVQAKTTYTSLYDYAAAPHQPTHIGQQTYTYDANGNLTGWTHDATGENRTVTWDAEDRITSVADQGSTTRYTYTDEGRLGIERGPQGETSFVNRYYTVRNGTVGWKHIWAGSERIASKREMPEGEVEYMRYFLHKDLTGSTNFITDANGQVFEYLLYFPGGEQWVLEHSDIFRTPYLYAGGYLDEFRELYNFGNRWHSPREQMFYSPDPVLTEEPTAPIDDLALLAAYSYAENNPLRLIDRDGRVPFDAQAAFRAAFGRPDGTIDVTKVRRFNAALQQTAADQLAASGRTSRFLAKIAANPKATARAGFKAFATYTAKPLVQINLKRTPDGLKLKTVKVAPFFLKQFTVKKGKP